MNHGFRDDWQQLAAHAARLKETRLDTLFARDADRVSQFSVQLPGLYLDFSRQLLDRDGLDALIDFAHKRKLPAAIAAMFAGETVNHSEQRAALHVALRGHKPENRPEIPARVEETLSQMERICESVRNGHWRGHNNQPISDVVNIGIGGSDLGPSMVHQALQSRDGPRCHFVSNIDPLHLDRTLRHLQPGRTLFLVASKSFTTLETLENAGLAKQWLLNNGTTETGLDQHFIAMTACREKAISFGLHADHILPLDDWVGGRYSLWSAIGLPIALGIGMPAFRQLLAGARDMDQHYLDSPLEQNMPVLLALLAFWYRQFWQTETQAVLPYSQALESFPPYLQQLEMESLGKSTDLDGQAVEHPTGAIIWGSAGTNGQHSFHQLLHQGTTLIPVDFIAIARCPDGLSQHSHRHLLANCLAQSQALMNGKSPQHAEQELLAQGSSPERARELAAHRATPGNRPSSTLLLERLDPQHLGRLLALYEHKVHALGVLLHINSFDQWGVELGKQLSRYSYQALNVGNCSELDTPGAEMVRRCRQWSEGE